MFDPERLDRAASALADAAWKLDDSVRRLTGRVEAEVAGSARGWKGPAADRFLGESEDRSNRMRRAADRMRKNATAPFVAVEINGNRFERVRAIEAPGHVERVNAAMADKYWTDIFVRFMSHPLTMRLKPDEGA